MTSSVLRRPLRVRIVIDRLVFDGIDVRFGSRDRLRAALEQELAHLVAAGELAPALAGGIAVPSLAAPAIEASGSPMRLGHAIAGAVYHSVGAARPSRG
jgi:hypothetical protein